MTALPLAAVVVTATPEASTVNNRALLLGAWHSLYLPRVARAGQR